MMETGELTFKLGVTFTTSDILSKFFVLNFIS